MRFFRWYQFVVPLALFPLSYLLWLRRYDGDHALVLLALSLPVVFAYVVPGLGTNWLGLWEINTRFRLGRFRPHHGFVFGTATSLFGLVCIPQAAAGFDLGACLRTADAAGASAVIVPRDRAAGLTPTVRKVASGAAETMPLIQVVNLARTLRWLKEREIWVVGADDQAPKSVFEAQLTGPLALVLGAEGAGLRRLTRENCDLLVGIPMAGTVESLNVSVAAGVLLFEAARQRRPS